MRKKTIFVVLLVTLVFLSACVTPATEAMEEPLETSILTVGDISYTKADLEALETMDADYTGKDGETTTYTGVSLAALLEDSGVSDGETVTFVAADGYEAEISMADVMGCTNCIVGFDGDSLRTVMPDFGGKLNVKDLVEINVN